MIIGISVGDFTGVGPEVTLKALASEAKREECRYLIIGDFIGLNSLNESMRLGLPLKAYDPFDNRSPFQIYQPSDTILEEKLEAGSPSAARAAVSWLRSGAELCLRQELSALVTAPVNKSSIIRSGIPFIGQTEFLTHLAGTDRTAMMLLGTDDRGRWLRVALATTHVGIKALPNQITHQNVLLAIDLAAQSCRHLGLSSSRVAVCGLNPHAGEAGEFGDEEITTIGPAIKAAQAQGIQAQGPFAADSLFYHVINGEYDVVVAMYHDQGLVALKLVAFESGVNWTLGLPFIRTSPDHGTAYNIAGKNAANPSSMMAAIRLAKQLASRQEKWH